jgi:secondary thiamine-phosphate synthase enzyme
MIKTIQLSPSGQGLHEFTNELNNVVSSSDLREGLCTVFIKHTSCSLMVQENADPSARYDLENWLNRLVSENDPLYTHTFEGVDDMPAHIKSALTENSLSIPFTNGCLCLGTWQGVFLWEHRYHAGLRSVVVHLGE